MIETKQLDPVCGMAVDDNSAYQADVEGTTYLFCSAQCAERFVGDPISYLAPEDIATGEQPVAVGQYTCPMHPEIISDGPGSCPKCGMALEPMDLSGDEDDPELLSMRLRFWVCAPLALAVAFIAMRHMIGLGGAERPLQFVQLGLTSIVVLWGGAPFHVRGWQSIVSRNPNMFTLIALGTGVAYLYSIVATIRPQLFPPAFRDAQGDVAVYFESAAVIVALVLLGQWLELRARGKTAGALRDLLSLQPDVARRIEEDDSETEVPTSELGPEDRIRVLPGARVPVDGIVLDGHGNIDESTITGEPIPVEKTVGDEVFAGTINGNTPLIVEARQVGEHTMLARITAMVAVAQRSKAPAQLVVDRVAAWFVPAVVVIAIVSFVVWANNGPQPRLAHAIISAVSVLIIACPCALGLATPMSIMVGMGRGARAGVLFRDAAALERLAQVDTLLVDKTGTLTIGQPHLAAMITKDPSQENELLALVASVERASEHPLASAFIAAAENRGLQLSLASAVEIHPGRGVTGVVNGRRATIGNSELMEAASWDLGPLEDQVVQLLAEGKTVVYVAVDGVLAGALAVEDPIRPGSKETIAALRAEGVRVVMITGDNVRTAQAISEQLDIDETNAQVLPEEKANAVERLRAQGRVVAMAGDGVNDAPALAVADVGIAMGSGTDIAMESGQVILVGGDLRALLSARRLSQSTVKNIRQNLFLAFAYNAIAIPIAAGVLYPVFGWLLSPMIAAAAMSFSSISVIANALRLRGITLLDDGS